MNRKLISLSIMISLGLAGCASYQERITASGHYEYLDDAESSRVEVPEGLDSPAFNDTYKLPELGDNAPTDKVGRELVIRSPALVLPVVSGTHVEEGSKQATVWFDQVDDNQALDTRIWNSLLGYLEDQNIGVYAFDKQQQTLITDWLLIESEVDSKWYTWTSTQRQVGKRFEFSLDVKPHGRTASLNVKLIDYLETVGDDVVASLDREATRRNEVDILNQVINHYEYQIRVADSKRIKLIRQGLDMNLGFDADGHPAFVVDSNYDIVWTRMLLVLRNLGFDVKDLDKSNGLLFVKYNGTDSSWWSNLWGGEQELSLDNEEYRMKVAQAGDKTSITLMDNESQPFSANRVTDLFDAFAKTMAKDDLDI